MSSTSSSVVDQSMDPELAQALLESERENANRPVNLTGTSGDDLWQVISDSSLLTTNCIMPKHLLGRAIRANVMPPLFFKITNPETNAYVICAAENFFDTEDQERLAIIPSILQTHLGAGELVSIEVINQSPDLIPVKAKTVFLEPQDELFYEIENPEKLLETCFSQSHFIGKDYLIPLPYNKNNKSSHVMIKINLIADEEGHELKFGNINNIDLNVEFVPIPAHLRKPKIVRKKPEEVSNSGPRQVTTSTKYDPNKKWVPFCGAGHRLSDGAQFPGRSQDETPPEN
jgi:hypothetical protein